MALVQQSMPGKNIIGCKFSVQNDWLINCKFAARYTSEQNAIKAEQSYAVEECPECFRDKLYH